VAENCGVPTHLSNISTKTTAIQTQAVIVLEEGETCTSYKPKVNVSTQTVDHLQDHTYILNFSTKDVGTQTCRELASLKILSEKDAVFYTGLSLTVYSTLVGVMKVHGNDLPYLLPVDEQILLTLVRLRLGLQFQDLGKRFGISCQLASKIFQSWISILSVQLKDLILWLPKESIKRSLPNSFKGTYPKTTRVLA
jgi:hypothetical protein